MLLYELSTKYMALMPYLCSPIMPHSFYRQTVHNYRGAITRATIEDYDAQIRYPQDLY